MQWNAVPFSDYSVGSNEAISHEVLLFCDKEVMTWNTMGVSPQTEYVWPSPRPFLDSDQQFYVRSATARHLQQGKTANFT
jgi:hypothetical protein